MATPTDITLTSLLPSYYVLVYAIPLLISSLVLTFAGAFLTLDRTCTFAPQAPTEVSLGTYSQASLKSKRKLSWRLEGGVGGLASGWVFGVHLSTFLSLIIMNRTTDAPLTPIDFLVIHLISACLFTVLAGRFRIVALGCTGLAGGVGLSLILAVVLHPTLLTRLIFIAILTPLVLVVTLLPVPRTQHGALRLAASSVGVFGTIVAIALLAHIPAWANVWERLWMQASVQNDWGTVAERGLSAAACIILVGGIVSDWFLRRQFGENPDQKWDAYLAQYAASLPNAADRAGTFQPIRSLWERLFHPVTNPVIFPPDSDLKPRHSSAAAGTFETPIALPKLRRKRSPVKFQPLGGYSDSDSDDAHSETEWNSKVPTSGPVLSAPEKPWLKKERVSSTPLSDATLYSSDDEDKGKDSTKSPKAIAADYSDSDGEDIATPHSTPLSRQKSRASQKSHRDEPGWKPDFLTRHGSRSPTHPSSVTAVPHTPPPGAVPMTPSLFRAIDRIAIAQSEAYGHSPTPPLSPPSKRKAGPGEQWHGFWERVQRKAQDA